MEKALIVIDYTNDFVAEDGVLTAGAVAQAAEGTIVSLVENFVKQGDYVVLTVDTHYPEDPYHPETKLFPPHNIVGTAGIELYGQLKDFYVGHQDDAQVYYLPKTRYSAFAGTDLDLRLRARGIRELHLVGVATDICVLHTAVDAYNLGYRIVVHRDGVASFNPAGHDWALGHFELSLGAEIR